MIFYVEAERHKILIEVDEKNIHAKITASSH